MDKLGEIKANERSGNDEGWISRIKDSFLNSMKLKANDKRTLTCELILFSIGFLLSRCHLLFGVRPLGLAFVCATPIGVWPTLTGSVIGALSLGKDGIIFATITAIAAFLRAAVSSSDKIGLFKEGLLLKMSVSVLSGFTSAAFEVLMSGFTEASMLFGLSMVILPPILTFIFSGLFTEEISLDSLPKSDVDIFSLRDREKNEKYSIILFQLSTLMLLFFIGLSFRGVNILGISISYIFSACITLLSAKRFGALRGLAVGFASSLGISGVLSVSFALAGLVSGALFSLGAGYAIIGGGAALCAFSAYSAGLGGLLGTIPEYLIASMSILPLLKKVVGVSESKNVQDSQESPDSSEEMVGTMALAYQNRFSGCMDSLDDALISMSRVIKSYAKAPGTLTEEEYRGIVIGVAEQHCIGCNGSALCAREGIRPCIKNAGNIALVLSEGRRITAENVNTETEFCRLAGIIADGINREAAKAERENYLSRDSVGSAEEYEMISGLINGAKLSDDAEKLVDKDLTPALNAAVDDFELKNCTIRAFGQRYKHFILACEDENGSKITSQKLKACIEKAANVKLGTPEYFRKGKMALMECGVQRAFSVSVATAGMAGSKSEISGDTVDFFETNKDYFYALISDGMGSGDVAKETSSFVSDFLRAALKIGTAKEALIHMLNHTVKGRGEECSATVDLFEMDLINGEATFLKSGAAPSFVKRESSIFRIRSQTAPIGLLSSIDTERIKVEIKPGDHIIMLSDGVADEADDAPWLLLLLGNPPKKNLQEYATLILNEAIKNNSASDDMSVAVIRIDEA